jgi:transcriptional regulator with XRE-family HTH domain
VSETKDLAPLQGQPGRLPGAPVAQAEVRSVRDSAGLTREQMADALGVMPLEVEAWESGAVAIPANRLERDRRLAEAAAPRCDWMEAHRPRLIALRLAGGVEKAGAEREERIHRRDCSACLRAAAMLREDPALEPPRLPGFQGGYEAWERWLRRRPWAVRLPLKFAERALSLAGLLTGIGLALVFMGVEKDVFAPMGWFLPLLVGAAGLTLVEPALERMWDDHPVPTWVALCVAFGLPVALVAALMNGVNLETSLLWGPIVLVVTAFVVLGMNAWEDKHPPRPRED